MLFDHQSMNEKISIIAKPLNFQWAHEWIDNMKTILLLVQLCLMMCRSKMNYATIEIWRVSFFCHVMGFPHMTYRTQFLCTHYYSIVLNLDFYGNNSDYRKNLILILWECRPGKRVGLGSSQLEFDPIRIRQIRSWPKPNSVDLNLTWIWSIRICQIQTRSKCSFAMKCMVKMRVDPSLTRTRSELRCDPYLAEPYPIWI